MGFNTNVNQQSNIFDKETLAYLLERKELLGELYGLLLDLQISDVETTDSPLIPIEVTNQQGESAIFHLIGINTTSLISSEMKGSITFTFIKDVVKVKKIETVVTRPTAGLRLVTTQD